jgi:hypothetical protein
MGKSKKQLRIAPPDACKRPMKANIFSASSQYAAQLSPMFPYASPGSIVPCATSIRSEGREFSHFHHTNSVDEVMVFFAAKEVPIRAGQVAVGARSHEVAGTPAAMADAMILMTVTQRQSEKEMQTESLAFYCDECHEHVFSYEFDATEQAELPADKVHILATVKGSEDACLAFNNDEANRKCSSCGHLSASFPNEIWGWHENVRRTEISQQAVEMFRDASR